MMKAFSTFLAAMLLSGCLWASAADGETQTYKVTIKCEDIDCVRQLNWDHYRDFAEEHKNDQVIYTIELSFATPETYRITAQGLGKKALSTIKKLTKDFLKKHK